jgi:hypothetical protein
VRELFRLARSDARTRGGTYLYGTCTLSRATHNEPATYASSYNYATGRAGRVSWVRRLICADHAVKFAKKHGIDINAVPTEGARPKHALDRILDGEAL